VSGLLYAVLWVLCNVVSRMALRYRTTGRQSIPSKGGILFAANHASYLDIPLLGCGIPRRVSFIGRANLFPHWILKWVLRSLGWIPLRMSRLDRRAFETAIAQIKAGKPVVIFPEGTRTPDGALQPGKLGMGIIVAETECPVIPVYISGTYEVLPSGARWVRCRPVSVHFGTPIVFDRGSYRNQKEFCYHVCSTVMSRIAELGQVDPPPDCQGKTASGSLPVKTGREKNIHH